MAPAVVRCDAVAMVAAVAGGWDAGVSYEREGRRARARVDVSARAVVAAAAADRQALVEIGVVVELVAAYRYFLKSHCCIFSNVFVNVVRTSKFKNSTS